MCIRKKVKINPLSFFFLFKCNNVKNKKWQLSKVKLILNWQVWCISQKKKKKMHYRAEHQEMINAPLGRIQGCNTSHKKTHITFILTDIAIWFTILHLICRPGHVCLTTVIHYNAVLSNILPLPKNWNFFNTDTGPETSDFWTVG